MSRCLNCGYQGPYIKMSFDVDESHSHLMRIGHVHTIRPVFKLPLTHTAFVTVHIHRGHLWTGRFATKQIEYAGTGESSLLDIMPLAVRTSGFPSREAWLNKLISMHGRDLTTLSWGLYIVRLL